MLKKLPIEKILPWLLFGIIAYFPLFLHLDSLSIRVWDESLYACNALEMWENGNWIVKYLLGKPDMWNTKPPLIIWTQVLSFKIFGVNELAFRLPVALLSACAGFLLIYFSKKEYGRYLPGFLAACILVTTPGFINQHVARTGDPDAPLMFFMLGTVMFYYRWLQHGKGKYLAVMTAFLIFATLTKSISGLLFLPGMFIYGIFHGFQQRKPLYLFQQKGLYLAILVFMVVVGGYYLLRESVNPGYLRAVWDNELGGRYLKTIEDHQEPFWFYWNHLLNERLVPWILVLPFAVTFLFFKPLKNYRNFAVFSLIIMATYFLTISGSQTKLLWYDAPLFPLAAWLVALVFTQLHDGMGQWLKVGEGPPKWIFSTVLVLFIFIRPYSLMIDKVYDPVDEWGSVQYGYFMDFKHKTEPDFKEFTIAEYGRNHHIDFYKDYYQWKHGYTIQKKWYAEELEPGEVVMSCHWATIDRMHQLFHVEELESFRTCRIFRVIKRKDSP